jgi:uncharacterized repeat protein (TIGR03803 family)
MYNNKLKVKTKNLLLLPALVAGLGLIAAGRVTAQTFTTLHSFTALTPYFTNIDGVLHNNSDGAYPYDGLILSGSTLYGTASSGGSANAGTVFAVNTDGTAFTNVHSFAGYPGDGDHPYGGLLSPGNSLYGTTSSGGYPGWGTVFAINTDGTGFTILHNFTALSGLYPNYTNSEGAYPYGYGGLILSGNTLYGTAAGGGSSGNGTVFSVKTDGTDFTNLHSFSALLAPDSGTNSDGAGPHGRLILSGNTLYGTASYGGSSGKGTVFKLLVNRAPSSVANVAPVFVIPQSGTNRFILSPNNVVATVVLDGSQSSDADNDPLQFTWYADGQTNPRATGAIATHQFGVGPHSVQLVVNDGHDTATSQLSFEVITPAAAVGQLMLLVDEAEFASRNKQPLLATLSAAMSSFDRDDVTAALNQLSAFQHKVRTQVAPWNPALAGELIGAPQQIITIVSGR